MQWETKVGKELSYPGCIKPVGKLPAAWVPASGDGRAGHSTELASCLWGRSLGVRV